MTSTSDSSAAVTSPYLTVLSSGLVLANKRQRFTSTCQFKLSLFFFDMQKCYIKFMPMNYEGNNDSTLTRLSKYYMITEGEWKLHKLQNNGSLELNNQSTLTYMIVLERKPMLYVVIFILPLFYLLILDLASYFISEARGEKLSFKVTILLSISVLLLILKDMLPSTEDALPLISVYCVIIFAMVGISLLEVMLVSFLIDCDSKTAEIATNKEKDENSQPEFYQDKEHAGPAPKGVMNPEKRCLPLECPDDHVLLKLILEEVKVARQECCSPRQEETKKPGCYKRLAKIIYGMFFVAYFLSVLIFLVYMYFVWIDAYLRRGNERFGA
ncbi:5-hydroxytryptamine receptor 3A [Thalassophryne amazonica]|uniref:5-hydroxytryptamine receptor 3A n=1 Tax=Thalassophryne amazonica TaxID=390379 RepID=UPI001470D5D7|nr:5-hydroxytryptamine receptor 3A [Thalassophryne amazonica]